MKPFKLEGLLGYRKRLEDHAHYVLAVSMEQKRIIEEARERALEDIRRLRRELESAKTKRLDLEEILLYERCIAAKQLWLHRLEEDLAREEANVAQKEQELIRARQNKRVLEILQENFLEAEKKETNRRETLFLDEVSVLSSGNGEWAAGI